MATFLREKHVKYWLRCLQTFLPHHYTSLDSNRLMVACFTLSALDLLGELDSHISEEERSSYIDWIYDLQLPTGGFRGFPGTDLGDQTTDANRGWDPANVPATYFALGCLLILRDDFARVKRRECLQWLRKMQRDDGSFGQTLGIDGSIEGGFDPRFAYTAMGIRWMLGADQLVVEGGPIDIDRDSLIAFIRTLQTYDGGISEQPNNEPHGGYVCCALAALSFVDGLEDGINDRQSLIRWLLTRQTQTFTLDNSEASSGSEEDPEPEASTQTEPELKIGFNGRSNKIADTCYTWWIGASLDMISHSQLVNHDAAIAYLLNETQHPIAGGFGKIAGALPDLYHSYLGLASLGLLGHSDVRHVHAAACLSKDTVTYLEEKVWPSFSK